MCDRKKTPKHLTQKTREAVNRCQLKPVALVYEKRSYTSWNIGNKKPWIDHLCFMEAVVRQSFGTGHSWVKMLFPYPDGMIANQTAGQRNN